MDADANLARKLIANTGESRCEGVESVSEIVGKLEIHIENNRKLGKHATANLMQDAVDEIRQAERERDEWRRRCEAEIDKIDVLDVRLRQADRLAEVLRKFAPISDGRHELILEPSEVREIKDVLRDWDKK